MACPRNNSTIRHSHRKMSSQLNNSIDSPFPQENTDTENRGNGGTLIKIIAVAAAILIGLGALIGGGAYTYHAYTTHVAEQQAEADRKQRQQSLVKAQNKWDGRKRKADDLVSTIKASPVAENSDVQKAMEALQKTTTGNPMTEKDITSALEKLDGEYEKTNRTYTDAMQAKAKETRTTLDGLVQQANGLADAPDGNDKKQMQSLASQWKSTEITSDNLSDAITASTELKNLISKVDKAKKDAGREEERPRKRPRQSGSGTTGPSPTGAAAGAAASAESIREHVLLGAGDMFDWWINRRINRQQWGRGIPATAAGDTTQGQQWRQRRLKKRESRGN